MYLHIWGSAYSPDATTGVCTFENNTYMWNEDPLGGHSTNVPAYVRAVWGWKGYGWQQVKCWKQVKSYCQEIF